MCKHCVYDPRGSGTWREQVRDCCGYTCPLYHLRPLPENHKHDWYKEPSAEEKARLLKQLNAKNSNTEIE